MNITVKRLLCSLGFAAICFGAFSPFVLSGELYPVDFIIHTQELYSDHFRYGVAYTNSVAYYKLEMTKKRKPRVLALGTSRVMQFNDFFFNTSFYNAGGGFVSSDAALYFLQQMPQNELPEYVILGLDEYFFNENYNNSTSETAYENYRTPDAKSFFAVFNLTITDLVQGKIGNPYTLAFKPSKVGVNAKVNNQGYENDGSYFYGEAYKNKQPDQKRIEKTMQDISQLTGRYIAGATVNPYTLDALTAFCEYAKEKGITVVAFTPPLAPACYQLATHSGNFEYINLIDDFAAPIFEQYGFEYYNYTDVQSLGLDDSYFIDGFHGSDSAYLALLLDMLNQGSQLNQVCDKAKLAELYHKRVDNFQIK